MAITSCGESPAEKAANQARKDYLKSSIKSTFEYIEKQNKAADEYNSQIGPDDAVMMIHHNPFDTTYTFDRIDKAKGKKFDDLEKYLKEPFVPFRERQDYFVTTKKDRMEDYMIFGLRKMAGVSLSRFEKEFGVSMEEVYGEVIRRYVDLHLLEVKGDAVRLTDAGIDVSNRIFEEFLL